MKTNFSLQEIKTNFPTSLMTHRESFDFIRENKLWQGMGQYGWLSKALIILAMILAMYAYGSVSAIAEEVSHQDMTHAFQTLGNSVGELSTTTLNFIQGSYFKYIVFILMEVVIFHFSRRTLEIKTNKKFDTTFNAFWAAEKRMMKVALYCAITEWALTLLISIGVSISGFDFLKAPLVLILQCYFLGFLMLDNFNEIFHLTIKESSKMTQSFAGVALAVGLVSYVLMLIPMIGSFLAPLLGAVTATIAMHRLLPEGPVSESHMAAGAAKAAGAE